ncbi:MAG TPA: hypothetical protein VFX16_26725 [Pseudonocardiaceae bacterium]|nr:hypothetical protein [Pseudonocardiaceae bacterium]
MSGIKVDPSWITGYAGTVEQAGDDLATALSTLRATPLTSKSFGDVGKQLGTPAAYQGAAATLQQQLARAVDALRSAAANLHTVAQEHTSSDEDQAAALRTAHHS